SPLPGWFQLEKSRVNPSQDFHNYKLLFFLGNSVHDRPQGINVFDWLAIHFDYQIAARKRTELSPTARLHFFNVRTPLSWFPLLGRLIEESDVTYGELEIIVAILFHFPPELRRADQLDRDFDPLLIPQNA